MVKQCMLALCAVTLAACAESVDGTSGDGTGAGPHGGSTAATGTPPAGADNAILAWARLKYGANLHEPVQTFFGDFTGDGVADALAWVLFSSGGNSDMLTVALFRNEGGRMVYHRSADDVFGAEPRNIVFAPGRITLTSTMPQPDDPRCCPTGSQDWVIDTKLMPSPGPQ